IGISSSSIKSLHLSYTIPAQYQYVIKPHKAIGDAARMFLVDRVFGQYQTEVRGYRRSYSPVRENKGSCTDIKGRTEDRGAG
ncbi:MAG: hypothetical protein WCF90_08790, partial [Methanomicrobiales archaeon]